MDLNYFDLNHTLSMSLEFYLILDFKKFKRTFWAFLNNIEFNKRSFKKMYNDIKGLY